MSLTERTIVDRLEVLRDGTVQVREATEILRDGQVISTTYHRYVIPAGDDRPDLSRLGPTEQAIVHAARTADRLEAARDRGRTPPEAGER